MYKRRRWRIWEPFPGHFTPNMPATASLAEREQTRRRRSIASLLLFPSLTDLFFIFTFSLTFLSPMGWDSLLQDGDTGMHIRAGDYILATHHVPTEDLFSFTRAGQPWADWEWLSQAGFAFLHSRWGLKGVVLFSGVLLAAVFTLLMRQALWRGANSIVALVLVLMAVDSMSVHLLARPHIFTMLFLMVAMFLIAADRRHRSAKIWILLPMTALWANMHGGFAILFPIRAASAWFGCGSLPVPRRPRQPLVRRPALWRPWARGRAGFSRQPVWLQAPSSYPEFPEGEVDRERGH